MNFFITSIAHYPEDEVMRRTSRCFGYYADPAEAVKAVRTNRCNMHEALYNYIVIETIEYGIHPEVKGEIWYQWDDDGNCWAPCDKPEWSFGTINWAIG